jgi:GNAT superfamily N-acetyltransferase
MRRGSHGGYLNPIIREATKADVGALVELTLLAFAPVFDSFQKLLGPAVYTAIWPDWRRSQSEAVETLCSDEGRTVLVAEVGGAAVGFIAYEVGRDEAADRVTGEVLLLAVHPDHQNLGIGTRLNERALDAMRDAGVTLAKLEAGGDASHAPARRSYENAGYVGLPVVRYYRKLR